MESCVKIHNLRAGEDGTQRPRQQARDAEKRLQTDGWQIVRKGPGDHVQYKREGKPGLVTIGTGVNDIPYGTLRSIYRQAGCDW
jgi:predicted RNA binding protein YcfA (HicA-like mRNA interferase family)